MRRKGENVATPNMCYLASHSISTQMSKSTGNFLTMHEAVERFTADGMLADLGLFFFFLTQAPPPLVVQALV